MNTPKTSKKSSIVALSPIPAPYSTLSEGNSTTTGHTTQSSRLPKRQGSVRQSVDRPSNVEGGDTPSEAATQRSFKTAVSAQTAATTAK
ncbi:hypothetical protein AGDE_13940 [Angomonas deanei]|nr:hypothetical protein AGDE_13940 [Angomonas deanei]|eukprot:EPY21587.1 hypothetical protein AGDE_13940 [Angomonas deanei]